MHYIILKYKYIELLKMYTFLNDYNKFFLLASKLVKLHIVNSYSFKQCSSI